MKTTLNKQAEAKGKRELLQAVLCNSCCSVQKPLAPLNGYVWEHRPKGRQGFYPFDCKSPNPASLWLTEF